MNLTEDHIQQQGYLEREFGTDPDLEADLRHHLHFGGPAVS
jgi:hypothetical protein